MAGDGTVQVRIDIPQHPYEVVIGNRLLDRTGAHLRQVLGDRDCLFVLTVARVRRRWGGRLMASLTAAGVKPKFIEMRDGEPHKKLATVEALAEKLAKLGA